MNEVTAGWWFVPCWSTGSAKLAMSFLLSSSKMESLTTGYQTFDREKCADSKIFESVLK
jgi:hypothetical protein